MKNSNKCNTSIDKSKISTLGHISKCTRTSETLILSIANRTEKYVIPFDKTLVEDMFIKIMDMKFNEDRLSSWLHWHINDKDLWPSPCIVFDNYSANVLKITVAFALPANYSGVHSLIINVGMWRNFSFHCKNS